MGVCLNLPLKSSFCTRREWVASEDGEALATQLISVLVAEHLSASGEAICGRLAGSQVVD